jgi:hypothetical protein
MKRVETILLILIATLIPFHGFITVALPDGFRFWKEALLGIKLLFLLGVEIHRWTRGKTLRLSKSETWALSFLIWLGALVVLHPDTMTAIVAARYLGMGVGVFFIFSRLFRILEFSERKALFRTFSITFLISCALSAVMGIWTKFFGGFEVLSSLYSTTISSWVPGQATPLYHEVDGFIRMQGGSSGPIEFAYLILMSFFLLLLPHVSRYKWGMFLRIVLGILFLFALFHSASRIAYGLAILGILFAIGQSLRLPRKIVLTGIIAIVLLGTGLVIGNETLNTKFVQRVGTSEHFTKPVEAFRVGLSSPILGKLGTLGPAARAKNLRDNNDDRALIAENVFADVFAQMGVVGLGLLIGFFVSLLLGASSFFYPMILATLVAINSATLFDMVPISIAFFILFAFFATMGKMTMKKYFV